MKFDTHYFEVDVTYDSSCKVKEQTDSAVPEEIARDE